jgi:fatty acid desaturase
VHLFKNRKDWILGAIIVVTTVNGLTNWFAPEIRIWQVVLSILLSVPVASTIHNLHHEPIFRWRPFNVLAAYWGDAMYALPASAWLVVHNRSHHVYHNSPDGDVTSTHFGGDRATFWSLGLDVWRAIPGFYGANFRYFADLYRKGRYGEVLYQLSHWVFLYGGTAALLAYDWRRALVVVVLPQQAAITGLTFFNYAQHVSTRYDRPLEVARNFTSPVLNFYTLNAGYHVVHHLKPRQHWSLAREEFERVREQVPNSLMEKSFWNFFLRSFILGQTKEKVA